MSPLDALATKGQYFFSKEKKLQYKSHKRAHSMIQVRNAATPTILKQSSSNTGENIKMYFICLTSS